MISKIKIVQEKIDSAKLKFIVKEFINMKSKDNVLFCKEGNHYFKYSIQSLLRYKKCPVCNDTIKYNKLTETFVSDKINKNTYFKYISGFLNNKTKLKLSCKKCNSIVEKWNYNYISADRNFNINCPFCSPKKKLNIDTVSEEIYKATNGEYTVIDTNYINTHTPILVKHQCGHIYKVSRTNILNGRCCPKCSGSLTKNSKGAKEIRDFLIKNNLHFEENKKMKDFISINNGILELDFFIPHMNVAIEYDGEQHFLPKFGIEKLNIQQKNDNLKNKYCEEYGIKLYRIKYNDQIQNKLNLIFSHKHGETDDISNKEMKI